MIDFINKHDRKIKGVLSCFDRILFKGYLPIRYPEAMEDFMSRQGLLLKDFKPFVIRQSDAVKRHALDMAARNGRPYIYLRSPIRKEEEARRIAGEDGISDGLVCIFAILEPGQSFKLRYGAGKPRLVSDQPRCLCLYYYFLHPDFGLVHVRMQTWFPFVVQICLNGHAWLARRLSKVKMDYQMLDNAFMGISNYTRAQTMADSFPRLNWRHILDTLARTVNPHMKGLLDSMNYYWVIDQAEFATDIIFQNTEALKSLYEKLLQHALICFNAESVLTFLGRKLHGCFQGEVQANLKRRWPGARIKHVIGGNWIKMYNKHGSILRVETVINRPYEFRIRRRGIRNGHKVFDWFPMAKRVNNMSRYATVCLQANQRYLQALASAHDPTQAYKILDSLTKPANLNSHRHRALNPLAHHDLLLFQASLRGEFAIHGFKSLNFLSSLNLPIPKKTTEKKRISAKINRKIRLLRSHQLIAKIPNTRRYKPTSLGLTLMSSLLHLHQQGFPLAFSHAA